MGFLQHLKSSNTFSYQSAPSADKKNASSVKEAKPATKFVAPQTKLKDLMPGKWYTPNAAARAQYHIDKFVHRDKIVKYAAAVGIGGAVVTGVLMGVGIIKVAAIGAFFSTPVGHGVLIGAGAAAGAYLLYRLGKFGYQKMKQSSAKRMAQVAAAREEKFNKAYGNVNTSPAGSSPAPQYNVGNLADNARLYSDAQKPADW